MFYYFSPTFRLQLRLSFQSSKYAPFHRSSSQEMAVSSRPPNNLTRQKCFSRLPFQINEVNFTLEKRPLRTFLDRPVQRKRGMVRFVNYRVSVCLPVYVRTCICSCVCGSDCPHIRSDKFGSSFFSQRAILSFSAPYPPPSFLFEKKGKT